MDGQMPEMDGLEATRNIRNADFELQNKMKKNPDSKSKSGRVPIIAVTANAMKGDRERFLAAGMDDYIAKPIKRAGLAEVIARCMKNNLSKAEVGGQ